MITARPNLQGATIASLLFLLGCGSFTPESFAASCAPLPAAAATPGQTALEAQREALRNQASHLESNFMSVRVQAAALGAVGGYLLSKSVCDDSQCKVQLSVLFGGLAVAGTNEMLKKSREYAELEQQLAEAREQLVCDMRELSNYHSSLREVIDEYRLQAAKLERQRRTGKAVASQAKQQREQIQDDLKLTQDIYYQLEGRATELNRQIKRAKAAQLQQHAADLSDKYDQVMDKLADISIDMDELEQMPI